MTNWNGWFYFVNTQLQDDSCISISSQFKSSSLFIKNSTCSAPKTGRMWVEICIYIHSVVFFSCVYIFYNKRATFSSICMLAASVYFSSAFCFLVNRLQVHCLSFFWRLCGGIHISVFQFLICVITLVFKGSSIAGYNSFTLHFHYLLVYFRNNRLAGSVTKQ